MAKTMSRFGHFSCKVTDLAPATRYHYRAVAVGDGTACGDDMTFTTTSGTPARDVPSSPIALVADRESPDGALEDAPLPAAISHEPSAADPGGSAPDQTLAPTGVWVYPGGHRGFPRPVHRGFLRGLAAVSVGDLTGNWRSPSTVGAPKRHPVRRA